MPKNPEKMWFRALDMILEWHIEDDRRPNFRHHS